MSVVASTIAFLGFLSFEASGPAADSSYCGKVRARANGDAALLLAPRLFAQVLRFPLSVDLGPATSNNLQLRVGLSVSPLDGYRGVKLMNISDIDCQAFESRNDMTRILTDALDGPVASAYRAQIDYLETHRSESQALLRQAQQRLDTRIITMMEFEEFFRRSGNFDHKLEEARGIVARYAARGASVPKNGLRSLAAGYVDRQRDLERGLSSLRSLDDWSLRVVGGAIPTLDRQLGWFGWIEASYNFGGLFRGPQERTYLKMRATEIEEASYEFPARLRTLEKEAQTILDHAERELSLVEEHLRLLARTQAILNAADTSAALHERDVMAVEHLLVTSDQVYWNALLKEVAKFLGNE
jgi:hypothetical protein